VSYLTTLEVSFFCQLYQLCFAVNSNFEIFQGNVGTYLRCGGKYKFCWNQNFLSINI